MPVSFFEDPAQEFSIDSQLDDLFGGLLYDIGAPLEVHENPIISTVIPPGDTPLLTPSFHHPLQDQSDIPIRCPVRIQNMPPLVEQYPTAPCQTTNERNHFPIENGNSRTSGVVEIGPLEQPGSCLPDLVLDSRYPEIIDASEVENDRTEKRNAEQTNFENQPPGRLAQNDSSVLNIGISSEHPASEVVRNHRGDPRPSIPRSLANFPAPEEFGGDRNQNVLDASLNKKSVASPVFHVRPSDAESERPAKRQRKGERISTEVDQMFTRGGMQNGQSRYVPTAFAAADGFRCNMLVEDIEHRWKTATGHSTMMHVADAAKPETAIHYAIRNPNDPLLGIAHITQSTLGITENQDLIQSPGRTENTGNATDLDLEEAEGSTEGAMEPSEGFSYAINSTRVKMCSRFMIMRLENPPECKICGKLYITGENLERHVRTVHDNPTSEIYKCTACKATFKNYTNLRRHKEESHLAQNFSCELCGVGFATDRALVLHLKNVHGIVPKSVARKATLQQPCPGKCEKTVLIYYECLLCPYASTVKGNLMRHIDWKHLNRKPYKCEFCGKRGKTKQNTAFHVQVCRKKRGGASAESEKDTCPSGSDRSHSNKHGSMQG